MEHVVDPGTGAGAIGGLANIAFDEIKFHPGLIRDRFFHLLQVVAVPGGEIVEPGHTLAELEQGLDQVRADEAGSTGNQPMMAVLAQLLPNVLNLIHSFRTLSR